MEMNDEYIDVNGALKRIGGNMGLFKKLLGRYVEGKSFEALSDAALAGNLEEAARLSHTLKGVSSNLSLMKVAALSTEIEQLFKNGSDFSGCLAELKDACAVTDGLIAEIINS